MKKEHLFPIILICLVWVLMVLVVNPFGSFPLNDDWMYSRVVLSMIKNGFYYTPDQYSPILVAQVLWGTLFCLPFGFSFNALRISVIVLGIAGTILFYLLSFNITRDKKLATICSMLLLANPLFFSLSNTFMTDVPFLVFSLAAIYFFIKSFDSPGIKYVITAVAFSVIASFIRQFGIVIPIAYSLTLIMKGKRGVFEWLKYSIPGIIAVLAVQLMLAWLTHIGSELHPYEDKPLTSFFSSPTIIAGQIFERGGILLYYVGIFLFPLSLFTGINSFRTLLPRQKLISWIFILFCTPFLLNGWGRFPSGNIINTGYLGPKTLKDTTFLFKNDADSISVGVKIFLSTVGLIGSVFLLLSIATTFVRFLKADKMEDISASPLKRLYILLCAAGYALLMFVPDFFFDRYLLPCIIFILLIVITWHERSWKTGTVFLIFSGFYIFLLASFSSLATHDYLAWNKARWQALNYLTKDSNISAHRIDGGYEFNGWVLDTPFPYRKNKSWWFVDDDEFIVSFGDIAGYQKIKKFSYTNYFPYEERNIYIIHRK